MIFEDEVLDSPFWAVLIIAPATVLVDCSPRRWVRVVGVVLTILLLPWTLVAATVALVLVFAAVAVGILGTVSFWIWDAVSRVR